MNRQDLNNATINFQGATVDQPFYTEGLVFTKNNDGTAYSVTDYTGTATEVVIPVTYDGLPVTSIGDAAFFDCSSLTSIDIPDGVTSIGDEAFAYCSSLESIDIPDSVTSIGDEAFAYCSSLESIDIPDSVTSIGDGGWGSTFEGCSSLTSIDIPGSVTSIGEWTFYGCSSLESIDIPDGVTSIGKSAFYGCSSLTTVNYAGTEEEWNAIEIKSGNDKLTNATINYNSAS